jgi:hypothetical protein
MSTLLSLRRALGAAVDELAPLAGTPGLAAKEAEIATLERTIGALDHAEKLAAKPARPIGAGPGVNVMEINPSQRTLSQIRGMDPRPGKRAAPQRHRPRARPPRPPRQTCPGALRRGGCWRSPRRASPSPGRRRRSTARMTRRPATLRSIA